MCGIAGFSLSANEWLRNRTGQVLVESLLDKIEVRGRDATGLAWRGDELMDDTAVPKLHYHKSGVTASTYMLEGWHLYGGHQSLDTIIHTRAGTGGSPQVKENNHPILIQQAIDFEVTKVGKLGDGRHALALVHNGVIYNDDEWFRQHPEVERIAEVDTEALAQCLALGGIEQVVEEIRGDAAIAWMDHSSPSLYVARLGGRPLEYAVTKAGGFVFASTMAAVDHAVERAGLSPAVGVTKTLPEGKMLEILHGEIVDEREVGKISRSFSSTSTGGSSTNRYDSASYWQERDRNRQGQASTTKPPVTPTTTVTTVSTSTKDPKDPSVTVTKDSRTIGKVLRRNGVHVKCDVCGRKYACLCDYNEYPIPDFPKDLTSHEIIPQHLRDMNGVTHHRHGTAYIELNGRYYPRDKFMEWAEDAEWMKRPVWRVLAMDLLGDDKIAEWYKKFWYDDKNRFGGDRNWYWMGGRFFARVRGRLMRRDPINIDTDNLVVAVPTLHSVGGSWCHESPSVAKAQNRTVADTALKIINEIKEWDQQREEEPVGHVDGEETGGDKDTGWIKKVVEAVVVTAGDGEGEETDDKTWGYRILWRSGLVSVIDGVGHIRHVDYFGEMLADRETGLNPDDYIESLRGVGDVEKITFWDAMDEGLDGTVIYPVGDETPALWVNRRRRGAPGNLAIESIADKAWADGVFQHTTPHREAHQRVLEAIVFDEGLSDECRIDALEAMQEDDLDKFMTTHVDLLEGLFS